MCIVVSSLLSLSQQRTHSNYWGLPSWETDCRVADPEIPLEPRCLVLWSQEYAINCYPEPAESNLHPVFFFLFSRLLLGLPRDLLAPDFLAKLSCAFFFCPTLINTYFSHSLLNLGVFLLDRWSPARRSSEFLLDVLKVIITSIVLSSSRHQLLTFWRRNYFFNFSTLCT